MTERRKFELGFILALAFCGVGLGVSIWGLH